MTRIDNVRGPEVVIRTVSAAELPAKLRQTGKGMKPPAELYMRSRSDVSFLSLMARPKVAIVGSRRPSIYGNMVTRKFASELAARGVVIISGLALGVDAIAHRAALDVGGLTIAVLPGPVDTPYPSSHQRLARDVISNEGALISEYPTGSEALRHHFLERNRIVTGLADILLITEATEHSGTMHTRNFAEEQGMDILAVPGDINSPTSIGTNNMLKTSRAAAVTDVSDVIFALNGVQNLDLPEVKITSRVRGGNPEEQHIIDLIEQGISEGNQLLGASGMSVEKFNHNLTMLEITAKIRPLGANYWSLA